MDSQKATSENSRPYLASRGLLTEERTSEKKKKKQSRGWRSTNITLEAKRTKQKQSQCFIVFGSTFKIVFFFSLQSAAEDDSEKYITILLTLLLEVLINDI